MRNFFFLSISTDLDSLVKKKASRQQLPRSEQHLEITQITVDAFRDIRKLNFHSDLLVYTCGRYASREHGGMNLT